MDLDSGNKMDKSFLMVFALVLGLLSSTALAATTSWFSGAAAVVSVNATNYEPFPAEPGKYLRLWVQVENDSGKDAEGVEVKLVLKHPFSLEPGLSDTKIVGKLLPSERKLLSYDLIVHPQAIDGDYDLNLLSRTSVQPWKGTEVTVTVSNKEPQIELIDSETLKVSPGQEGRILLKIKNVGEDYAEDLLVGIKQEDLMAKVESMGSVIDVIESPIKPLGKSFVYIESLAPGAEEEVSLKIAVDSDASLKTYFVPITITYKNDLEDLTEIERVVGLKVSSPPEVDMVLMDEGILYPGASGEVIVDIFNTGAAQAKYLIVEASTAINSRLLPSNFVGTLEPDDVDSIKFSVHVGPDIDPGMHAFTVLATYKDNDMAEKTLEKTFMVEVFSESEAKDRMGQGSSTIYYAVIVLFLVYAGYRVYKKRKHGKKK